MLPDQHPTNQPGSAHSAGFNPQAAHFDYGAAPKDTLQQHPNGTYEVVPPPVPGQNAGHSGHNPYEFIMQPNMPKRSNNPLKGGRPSWKLLVIAGVGLILIMIVVAVVMSSLAPKGSVPGLTAAAQREQEIIRIATAIQKNATSSDVRNLAVTTQITVTSNQQRTLSFLANHQVKLKAKQLALDYSTQTDNLLSSAATAGTYDTIALQTLTAQLETYETLLQNTYKQTSNSTSRTLLQTNFDTAQKLVAQAKAADPNSNE